MGPYQKYCFFGSLYTKNEQNNSPKNTYKACFQEVRIELEHAERNVEGGRKVIWKQTCLTQFLRLSSEMLQPCSDLVGGCARALRKKSRGVRFWLHGS